MSLTKQEWLLRLMLIASLAFCAYIGATAQSVIREGNTFKSVTKKAAKDTLLTNFKYEDSKGIQYPIIVNKANGRCWIWKKSGKTGRFYKMYLMEEVARRVCEELGITYIPKQTRS